MVRSNRCFAVVFSPFNGGTRVAKCTDRTEPVVGQERSSMTPTQRVRTIQALLVAALFAVVPPEDAVAQGGPGFLFKEPVVSVGLSMG